MIKELQLLPSDLKKQKECTQILNDYISSFRYGNIIKNLKKIIKKGKVRCQSENIWLPHVSFPPLYTILLERNYARNCVDNWFVNNIVPYPDWHLPQEMFCQFIWLISFSREVIDFKEEKSGPDQLNNFTQILNNIRRRHLDTVNPRISLLITIISTNCS